MFHKSENYDICRGIKHNDIWIHTQHPFAFQENQEFKFVSAIQFGTEINKHALSKVRDEITMKDMEEIIKNVLLSRSGGKYSTQWISDTFNLLFQMSVKCGPMVLSSAFIGAENTFMNSLQL